MQTKNEIKTPNRSEDEINAYRDFVNSLRENNSTETFRNSGPNYASIVFGNIFKSSNDSVRIFSGKMNKKVTNDSFYLEQLKNFIEKGGKIQLMLQEEEGDPESIALSYLEYKASIYPEQIKIKKGIGPKFFLEVGDDKAKQFIHFSTGDTSKFRLELDKDDHKALCCLNNTEYTAELIELFDKTFES